MKRIVVLMMLTVSLLVTACAGNGAKKWGSLDVSLAGQKADANEWKATVLLKNNTKQTALLQYTGPVEHTLTITRNGKEIYKQVFNPVKDPKQLHNLLPNTDKQHLVIWRYVDQEGKKVSPGTYQAKVEIHAVTVGAQGAPQVPPVNVTVK